MTTKTNIQNPPRKERLIYPNGNTTDIINTVMDAANDDHLTAQIFEFAQQFKGNGPDDQYEKLEALWRYTRKDITYEEDPPGEQYIKDPARTFWDNRKGDGTDCKSKSLFEYFVCRAIGVPCYFEFVSYFDPWDWVDGEYVKTNRRITHVYPVAVINGGEVVIDAVHTRFDERAPGATRVVKKYSKVYKEMTKIYRISGIGKAAPTMADIEGELNDRAKLVKPTAFVDFPMMTEGEMETFLLAQRAKMLSEFYQGTPQGAAYRADFLRKRDALYNGLHTGFNIFGAKAKTRPASGWLPLSAKGINIRKGFDALFDDAESGADRVSAIPQIDCNFPFQLPEDQQWKVTYNASQTQKRIACETENLWRDALNKDWEGNGPVMIYEFLTDGMVPGNLSGASILLLGGKDYRQKYYVDKMAKASKISRSLLDTWLVNGCIAKSVIGANGQSLGPQLPIDYINALRQGGQEGVGAFPLIVIPIALAVMALNYNAVKNLLATIQGKQTLKQAITSQVESMQDFIEKYSSEIANLAAKDDWKIGGAGGSDGNVPPPITCDPGFHLENGVCVPDVKPPSSNKGLLIGAAAVGLALMLSNEKN